MLFLSQGVGVRPARVRRAPRWFDVARAVRTCGADRLGLQLGRTPTVEQRYSYGSFSKSSADFLAMMVRPPWRTDTDRGWKVLRNEHRSHLRKRGRQKWSGVSSHTGRTRAGRHWRYRRLERLACARQHLLRVTVRQRCSGPCTLRRRAALATIEGPRSCWDPASRPSTSTPRMDGSVGLTRTASAARARATPFKPFSGATGATSLASAMRTRRGDCFTVGITRNLPVSSRRGKEWTCP